MRAWEGRGGARPAHQHSQARLPLNCKPQFGAIHVRCLLTPGHTSGHMSYFLWEDECPDPPALFSGTLQPGARPPPPPLLPATYVLLTYLLPRGLAISGWLRLASGGHCPADVPKPGRDSEQPATADGERGLALQGVQTLLGTVPFLGVTPTL